MAVLVLLVALVPLVAFDLRHRLVPDAITGPAAIVAAACAVAIGGRPLWSPMAAAGLVALPLLVAALLRPDGMGMGDVKLAGLIGVALGVGPGLAAVLVGLVLAAAWGFGLAGVRRIRPSTVGLPLVPFLAVGVVAVVGPVAFVHSAHGSPRSHAPEPQAAVRHAHVGGRHGRWHAPLAGPGAGAGAGHRCRCGQGGRAAAP